MAIAPIVSAHLGQSQRSSCIKYYRVVEDPLFNDQLYCKGFSLALYIPHNHPYLPPPLQKIGPAYNERELTSVVCSEVENNWWWTSLSHQNNYGWIPLTFAWSDMDSTETRRKSFVKWWFISNHGWALCANIAEGILGFWIHMCVTSIIICELSAVEYSAHCRITVFA